MLEKDQLQKLGVTPGRMILIGVLGVILLGVVGSQLFLPEETLKTTNRGREAGAAGVRRTRSAQPPGRNAGHRATSRSRPLRDVEWPEMVASQVAARDPFHPPTWAVSQPAPTGNTPVVDEGVDEVERQAAGRRERLIYLRQQGVQAILSDGDEKFAIVDGRQVRVDDVLEGFRVTEITDQGISLVEQEAR